jgi:epoxyqueuosine reductase
MITKQDIINEARRLQFADIGFTTADPFESQKEYLLKSQERYGWAEALGLELVSGTDPKTILSSAQSIIVVLQSYFEESFPSKMERHFGRCYIDDDRMTKDGLALKIKALRNFLREGGIDSRVPFNLPHRLSAARAGLGTFGKNCLFYARRVAGESSFVFPIALVVDRTFPPDEPSIAVDCPEWCRNACVAACPTHALTGNGKMDPRRCISFLTYYGEGLTPMELREPMGLYIYGCDRCQNVCPRNINWMTQERRQNPRVAQKAADFDLARLLHMDRSYFLQKVWPHMFYMSDQDLWRWKMNVARAMGNSLDPVYVVDLIRAFEENSDERVRSMIAWALGRIGNGEAVSALEHFDQSCGGMIRHEIKLALVSAGAKP